MAFFRSEKMSLYQMLLHSENAFECLVELGYLGEVQFNDLDPNHPANLRFISEAQRCSEMARIIQHLYDEIDEYEIKITFYPEKDLEVPRIHDMKDVESALQELETELNDVVEQYDELRKQESLLREKLHVLERAEEFLTGERNTEAVMAWTDSVIMNLLRDESQNKPEGRSMRLGFFTGSIPVERFPAFEVMLWRVCRGNFFLRHAEIPTFLRDSQRPNVLIRKHAFMVLFMGETMRKNIRKVCDGFQVTLFECPEGKGERTQLRLKLTSDIEDIQIVVGKTDEHRKLVLSNAAADIYLWNAKVKKMLLVYTTLNKFGLVKRLQTEKYLQAECWIPTARVAAVHEALMRGADRAAGGSTMKFPPILTEKHNHQKKEPPTCFLLNKFTRGFQTLIDAYGIAQYRELNPAPYTIVTFPFLFAVMFGDIGHGFILTLFGAFMIYNEQKIREKRLQEKEPNEMWNLLTGGRYIIFLMGVFSMYTGFIYNDVFSKCFNMFGSSWRVNNDASPIASNQYVTLDPADSQQYLGYPYFFGIDPAWHVSGDSAIIFFNSFKMKLAIILGVTQMIFGLGLSAVGFWYEKRYDDFFLVFVPEILFFVCLFLYLVFLMFFKWFNYGGSFENPYNSACAPSILITFINMILLKGSETPPDGCEAIMFPGQELVQTILVVIAFATIPVLLAGKPMYIMRTQANIHQLMDHDERAARLGSTQAYLRKSLRYTVSCQSFDEIEDIDITDLWIHQGIHCIESVLGSISHTASYLRLWALSLAHNQLSSVLWNMVLRRGFKARGYFTVIYLIPGFAFWAVLTIAILVLMEGLSAFLHTLRLHWVEFQSKFYQGSGERFYPFKFLPDF